MARVKNNITKSGASLINERTRFYRNQNQQVRSPYIPNGYNTDNLIVNTAYNDQNTINFNNLKYLNPKKYFNIYPNQRNTINEQLATPSTFPNLGIVFQDIEGNDIEGNNDFYNDQKENLEKFLKKGNSVETKFVAFNDEEYIENNSENSDFIKGEGKFSFLNKNLYEETSVEIELDVPADALLEYTAKMQEQDINNSDTYITTSWNQSPYAFRQNASFQIARKNSPFLMYNFNKKAFESRGYYARQGVNSFEGQSDNIVEDIKIIPSLNFEHIAANNIQIVQSLNNDDNIFFFVDNFNKNAINHHLALTNIPINQLRPQENSFEMFNYSSLPTLQFGFPHFPVFHTFNDNLLPMKKFLNKNLIVDRITVDLNVRLKAEISTNQENEDLDIRDGLNFSLNYFILNSPNNKKDLGNSFLLLKPQDYFKDFTIKNLSSPFNKLSYSFITTHFNNITLNKLPSTTQTILNGSKQNLKIHRKLWGNLWGEEGDLNRKSFDFTDMSARLNEINFNKNIVSFGNVLFHASNKNFLYDIIDNKPVYDPQGAKLSRFQHMKNNNDLVIDTLADNIAKSTLIDNNVSKISNDFIFLDFDDRIKINSYVKKAANYSDLARPIESLNSNNLNYQIEFKSNLKSTLQYTLFNKEYYDNPNNPQPNLLTGDGFSIEKTSNYSRNMLNNKLDGKDIVNAQSELTYDLTKTIGNRKTSKNLFRNLKTAQEQSFNSTQIDDYYNNYQASDSTNLYFDRSSNFSPYVLTPNDNLAFCFSISPTISPKLFAHSCQIKAGKVKFTLHGYIKKNNEKIQDYNNLKNLNQQNLSSTIIGDNSIISDDYSNLGYLAEYINTFNDRIFQGELKLSDTEQDQRKLNSITPSKILSGKSYIPYTKLEPKNDIKWIYDNDVVFSEILRQLLITDNQNPDINSYLTSYRGTIDENDYTDDTDIPPGVNPLETDFDRGEIEYFDFNIAAAITPFKLDFKSLKGPIIQIQQQYETQINDLINSIPIFGLIFATLFVLDKLSIGGFINRRHNFSCYYNNRKYGQFIDMLQQRLFTTEMSRDVNNIPVVEYVLEQKFINNINGVELTNLSNPLIPRNKSKNLQLIDSGFKSITSEGVITPWDVSDFFNLKHVAYNDEDTSVFL